MEEQGNHIDTDNKIEKNILNASRVLCWEQENIVQETISRDVVSDYIWILRKGMTTGTKCFPTRFVK